MPILLGEELGNVMKKVWSKRKSGMMRFFFEKGGFLEKFSSRQFGPLGER